VSSQLHEPAVLPRGKYRGTYWTGGTKRRNGVFREDRKFCLFR